jgi:hypothetical protein
MQVAARPEARVRAAIASANRKREKTIMQSFTELPLSPYTQERLAQANFSTPTPIQAAAIPQALAGKDVLATAQTGTGKTMAFLIPVIERLLGKVTPGISTLVLVPTRELAMQVVDQYNALRGNKLTPAVLVVGGLSEGQQLTALRRGGRLVVATPGRLEDFLDRRLIDFRSLQVLILDEADRMLDMGFLPAIRRIAAVLPKDRPFKPVGGPIRRPSATNGGSTLRGDEESACARKLDNSHKREALETSSCRVFIFTFQQRKALAREFIPRSRCHDFGGWVLCTWRVRIK